MLNGKLTALAAVEKSDLQQLMDWRNNPALRQYFREYREINSAAQERWFEQKVMGDANTIMFAVRKLGTNQLIGCCGLVAINWLARFGDLSLYIGKDGAYIDEEGYAKDACLTLLNYGFNELGLNKVWTEVYEFDHKKKGLCEETGFHLDGVLRQHCFCGGKWHNSLIFSLLKGELKI